MQGMYEDHGVRFMYPHTWEQEESEDGTRTLLTVSEPGGTAFAMISLDTECPAPVELADEALETLRADYPDLDSDPVIEEISDFNAIGHDVEFFSFDFLNICVIRCFRTPRRTVLFLAQWSETADGEGLERIFAAIRKSFQETDSDHELGLGSAGDDED